LIFQRDTAFQLALRLTMRRILATLAVIALLFSAGSAWADSNSEANELFVKAVKLVKSAENTEDLIEKSDALEKALGKLNEIIDDHPSSDLAVKLITNQNIGDTSLKDVAKAAKRALKNAEIKAAEQGDAKAQYNLGFMYDYGRGFPENNIEAVKWYRKAAEQGHAKAQYNLGIMYRMGWGVPQNDDAEAVKWYRMAAEQGHAKAQYILGVMYDNGWGVPENDAEAVKWWRKAAEQGHADAQFSLGFMYNVGRGVPKNDTEAVKWWRKAAEQGLAPAQLNLGDMYRDGYGVPKNDVEAVKWYRKAAEQGNEVAKVWLKDLEAK
jgi:TPR repeat protein